MSHSLNTCPSRNVRFYTIGCKVNQYETQAMREALEREGYRDIEGQRGVPCDWVVINTCTVTYDSDRTNRYWIRRLRREHPEAKIAVTGCYVEKNRSEIESMREVDLVFLNHEKHHLARKLQLSKDESVTGPLPQREVYTPLFISRSEGKTRAYVKIQDGCNHACSYCKVSIVRGSSRSRMLPDILEEVKRLRDNGYREIILTGIQLGAYGADLVSHAHEQDRSCLLRDVIEACVQVDGIERIRLSSIELTDLGRPLREAFSTLPKLCPHIHLPLQSGDNDVLAKMNRRYTREAYRDVVMELKGRIRDFEFSVDVMAGFPGETETQFSNTIELLEMLQPLKIHVFPYSRRERTAAADWEALPAKIVRDRVRRLSSLAERLSAKVRQKYLGRSVEILAEHADGRTGLSEGLTPNYLKVFFEYPHDMQGCIIPFKLTEYFRDGFRGISVGSLEESVKR